MNFLIVFNVDSRKRLSAPFWQKEQNEAVNKSDTMEQKYALLIFANWKALLQELKASTQSVEVW